MVAPLNTCAAIEQRGVVRFLWAKGMAAKDIYMSVTSGSLNWVQKFSEGRTSIENEHLVGRPVEIATPAKNFTPQVSSYL
jgi:hypothetical protein